MYPLANLVTFRGGGRTVWDRCNSAARSCGNSGGKLKGKAWRGSKARQRPGICVEMWHSACLSLHLDKKSGLALAQPSITAGGNDGAKPAAFVQLSKKSVRYFRHAAVQKNDIEWSDFRRAARKLAIKNRRFADAK